MSTEMQGHDIIELPATSTPAALTQIGNKNTQVAHANQVIANTNIFLTNNGAASLADQNGVIARLNSYLSARSREYYNLFVINGETFENGRFFIRPDRALTESIDTEIKRQLASLSEDAKVKIKTFPSLFMSELNRIDQEQIAYYGFVTDIVLQGDDIRIEFQTLDSFPQHKLNEIYQILALEGRPNINELDRTHWTIKQVDLLGELKIAGLNVFGAT